MNSSKGVSAFVLAAVALAAVGCIPYTVGTTAQPVAQDEPTPSVIWYAIPGAVEILRDSLDIAFTGIDVEVRIGVSERADVGIRIPSFTGLVITYKHRLTPARDSADAAVAVMGGFGLVNLGNHLHFEFTVIASARQRSTLTPYGGLRIAQVAPLSEGAVGDSPTAGGFVGLRIGTERFGVSPEVGVSLSANMSETPYLQ